MRSGRGGSQVKVRLRTGAWYRRDGVRSPRDRTDRGTLGIRGADGLVGRSDRPVTDPTGEGDPRGNTRRFVGPFDHPRIEVARGALRGGPERAPRRSRYGRRRARSPQAGPVPIPALDCQSLVDQSEFYAHVTDASTATTTAPGIGLGPLRDAPAGMPDPAIVPPTIAEAGDPFTAIRVIDLIARLERGRPIRLADIADRLDATYLDWLFPVPVVADVALQLQANWMTDYRNSSGIIVEDGPSGPTLTLEDSSRVDPWIVRQAQRAAADCTERLAEFSRRDRPSGG